MTDLIFQDGNGVTLNYVDLTTVKRGFQAPIKTVRAVNLTDHTLMNVKIEAMESTVNQLGQPIETYNACYLSLDNDTYDTSIFINIEVGGFTEFYIKWRPSDNTIPGDKQWALKWSYTLGDTENYCELV